MEQLVMIIHVLVAVMLVGLVLVQHGKGADVGAAFGSGASNTMFGSQGAMPFLMKVTVLLAALFFATSLIMSYLVGHSISSSSGVVAPVTQSATEATQQKSQQFVFPSVQDTQPHQTHPSNPG